MDGVAKRTQEIEHLASSRFGHRRIMDYSFCAVKKLIPPQRGRLLSGFIEPKPFLSASSWLAISYLFLALFAGSVFASDPLPTTEPAATSSPANPSSPVDCGEEGGGNCGEDDVGSSSNSSDVMPVSLYANPINIMTGNKFQREIDFHLPGSKLMFKRTYNSYAADTNIGLGLGWSHSYAVTIVDIGNGQREIVQSNGARVVFSPDGENADGLPLMRAVQNNHGYVVQDENKHRWHLPDGRVIEFHGSYLASINWPDQRKLTLFYEGRRLSSVNDETGRQLRFSYTPEGLHEFNDSGFGAAPLHLEKITLPDGTAIGYDYDNKRLTRVRYSDNTNRQYHYENEVYTAHLTGLSDRTGVRYATWKYDDYGRAISSEHANGIEKVSFDFPDLRAVDTGKFVQTKITNSLGDESTFVWLQPSPHASPRLLSSDGAGCGTCPQVGYTYTYDDQGRLIHAIKTGDGNAVGYGSLSYSYEQQGRLSEIRRTDAAGQDHLVKRYEYEGLGLQASRIYRPSVNPDGERVLEVERNDAGLATKIVEKGYAPWVALPGEAGYQSGMVQPQTFKPIERVKQFNYVDNKLVSIDGPRNDVQDTTTLTWNDNNRLVGITYPTNKAMELVNFDAMGRATEYRKGEGSSFFIEYTQNSQIASISYRENKVKFEYDAEGRTISYTDAFGKSTKIERDSVGRLLNSTDAFGRRMSIDWDTESRRTKQSAYASDNSLFSSVERLFREDGLLESNIEQQVNPHGDFSTNQTNYAYDETNQLIEISRPETAQILSLTPDVVNRSASVESGGKVIAEYTMDRLGRESGKTDAKGNTTKHIRDDFGRRVAVISLDTGIERFERNSAGQVVKRVREDSGATNYQYDAAGRIVKRSHSDGTVTDYEYDLRTGKLTSIKNEATLERFEYSIDGDLLNHTRQIDGHSFETLYQYNERGQLIEKELPDGEVLVYSYHTQGINNGTLKAINRKTFFGRQVALIDDIDLEKRDGYAAWSFHNGLNTQMQFSASGHVLGIDTPNIQSLQYEYDAQQQVVGINDNGKQSRFAYRQGKLVNAQLPESTRAYDYDALGNRRALYVRNAVTNSVEATEYHYTKNGEGNRLIKTSDMASGLSQQWNYSAGGAPLDKGAIQYRYDAERRPIEATLDSGVVVRYSYNGFGERISKTVYSPNSDPIKSYFLYDNATLSAVVDQSGDISNQYIYLEGYRPVAQLSDGDVFAIHTDSLGTPQAMSNDAAELVWSASYTPFGKATVELNTVPLALRLPGQYADTETNTHYNYFRDYDPSTGRYLTSDPIGLAGGDNTYAYALLNPLSYTDALGLFAENGSLSLARMEQLHGNPAAIREFVNSELQTFEDRHNFYAFAHNLLNGPDSARQSDWFLAASQVNDENALGMISSLSGNSIDIVEDETREYVEHVGLVLAEQNIQTFLSLYFGESIHGVDGDDNSCGVHLEGIELDLALVRYEQERVSQITANYEVPEGFWPWQNRDMEFIVDNLNDLLNYRGIAGNLGVFFEAVDPETHMVVTHFWPNGDFDYDNIEDRVKLGQSLVRLNAGLPWQ